MRAVILGGTFNPPHIAHLVMAQEAHDQLGLERVVLVPVSSPPHKESREDPGAEERLALCELAVAGDERFAVSDLEMVREGPSYTVDTLEELHSKAPENELFLILGGDVAAGLPSWHEPERVLSLATVAVAKRRGTARSAVDAALQTVRGGERVQFFQMPRIGISSTFVRRRARAGISIKYIVPDAVASYIEEHGLYGGPTSS